MEFVWDLVVHFKSISGSLSSYDDDDDDDNNQTIYGSR